ncbi:MAG: MarR family transcriptional regulator [Rhodocyclales bacterium GT-UBC]|nr:MAG: MarR family transcriptional regulator [Rhodocyclales bacterium GT-UBC]
MDSLMIASEYISNKIISVLTMNEQHQHFSSLLHRCSAVWRARIDERLRPWGMTQATWRTLWILRQGGERLNQSLLAARLGIETPTLVRILDRMEKLGLLERVPDPQDRRQKYIEISARGLALAAEIEGEVVATREEMLGRLGADEVQAGIAILEKILASPLPRGDAEPAD